MLCTVCVGCDAAGYNDRCRPLTMASCLLSVASSGEQLSALMGVCACHWPTLQRAKWRECVSLRTCTSTYFVCVPVWVYSSYESHSVGATMHLRPARQMCIAWLYFKSSTTIQMVSALLCLSAERWMIREGYICLINTGHTLQVITDLMSERICLQKGKL